MYALLAFCLATLAEGKSGQLPAARFNLSAEASHESRRAVISMLQTATAVHRRKEAASNLQQTALELSPHKNVVNMQWVVPPNDPTDWLFGVQTTKCGTFVTFDNEANSILSRLFIPTLLMIVVSVIMRLSFAGKLEKLEAKGGNSNVQDPERSAEVGPHNLGTSFEPAERLWHVDFARISAVVCVIFEHCGGMGYSRRNMAFGLYWTMPYMFMTCGTSIMMSKSSMMGYQLRLVCLFLVGVSCNLTGDIISHRDWQHDPMNTLFQMIFVLMLIVMAFITEPLRQALLFRKNNPDARAKHGMLLATFVCLFLTCVGLWSFIQNQELLPFTLGGNFGQFYSSLTESLPIFLIEFCGFLFLCLFACVLGPGQNSGWVGWVLLSYIYLPGIVAPWHEDCFPRWLCLYIFAMVTFIWPMKGQERLRIAMRSYWPFFMMILCLIAMPNMTGRCDMFPPGTLWERSRERTGEILMTICFVTAAFQVSDPWNVTVWMGRWALFAYCVHLGLYRVLGSPWGPTLTFSAIPLFYVIHLMSSKRSADNKAP